MDKVFNISKYFADTYEPSVQVLDMNHVDDGFSKVASEAYEYIKTVTPKPGKRYIFIIAMGAGEHWGCFLPGAKVLMADGSEKSIENVEENDYVTTHTGKSGLVIKTLVRDWGGDLYKFKFASYGHPLVCTEEHPIYAVKGSDVFESRKRFYKQKETYENFIEKLSYKFIEAKNLSVKDYVAVPFEKGEEITEELGDLTKAYALGYYAGNGCGSKEYRDVITKGEWKKAVFIIRKSDTLTQDTFKNLMDSTGHSYRTQPSNTSDEVVRLEYGSKDFITVCKKHFGGGARTKFISSSVMKMPPSWQRRFLAGYLQADGHQIHKEGTRYHGGITSSTASRKLSQDLVKLCARLGYHCSSFKFVQHHTSISAGKSIYQNSYDASIVTELGDCRFFPVEKTNRPYSVYIDHARGYLLYPIKSIEVEEREETVYNLEVEGDNSYCVNSIAVHNCNKNGDYFPEADLLKSYRNFETQFDDEGKINGGALVYKHHKNKLHLGHPWFGTVCKAFYNNKMHRVELILEIDEKRAPDEVRKIDNGDDLAFSMGVRIPEDYCSVCGNAAKTRDNYCDHLKWQLGKILPDGRRVAAINGLYDYNKHKKPLNFFDISMVFRPADPTGWMLKKVASEDEHVIGSAEIAEKQASLDRKLYLLNKYADMHKILSGEMVASKDDDGDLQVVDKFKDIINSSVSEMPILSEKEIGKVMHVPMSAILSTLAEQNVILTTPEFISLIMSKMLGRPISPAAFTHMAKLQGEVLRELSQDPDQVEELCNYDMFDQTPSDPLVKEAMADFMNSRTVTESLFVKKAGFDLMRSGLDLKGPNMPGGDGRGMLHTETVVDPDTGKRYDVSMDAIEEGQWNKDRTGLIKALGAAATLGALYWTLKAGDEGSVSRSLAPLAGITGIALGLSSLKDAVIRKNNPGAYWTSESGRSIPREAVMIEKRGAFFPNLVNKLDSASRSLVSGAKPRMYAWGVPTVGVPLLSQHYEGKLKDGTAGYHDSKFGKTVDELGNIAYNHPLAAWGVGVGAGNLSLSLLNDLRKTVFRK